MKKNVAKKVTNHKRKATKRRVRRKKLTRALIYIICGSITLLACVYGIGKMLQTGMNELYNLGGKITWYNYAIIVVIYVMLIFLACVSMIIIYFGTSYVDERFRSWKKARKR